MEILDNINNNQDLFTKLIKVTKHCGNIAKFAKRNEVRIYRKDDGSVVTSIDLVISNVLAKYLPSISENTQVISEENICEFPYEKRKKLSTYWLIDPLDGTTDFIKEGENYSILISLMHNNEPVLGLVYCPVKELWLYAAKGYGTYKLDVQAQYATNVQDEICKSSISEEINLPECTITKTRINNNVDTSPESLHVLVGNRGIDNFNHIKLNKPHKFTKISSAGMKGILVAIYGDACYITTSCMGEWDVSAIQIIIQESGGEICHLLDKSPIVYNKEKLEVQPIILISNKKWLDEDLYSLSDSYKEEIKEHFNL